MRIINEYEPLLAKFKAQHGFTDEAIDKWLTQEMEYLKRVKSGPRQDMLAMNYVDALSRLDAATYVLHASLGC